MARPNFYILLELDAEEHDLVRIEAAIKAKQGAWSRERNHPTRGRQAQQNLELLKMLRVVMADPGQRAEEAKDAARLRQERAREAARQIDEAIGVLARAGFLTEPQVAELVRRFAGRFTEDEVRRRITVPIRLAEDRERRPQKPTIEPSLFRELADRLRIVGNADLYEFLDLRRNNSLKALTDAARAVDAEARKYNAKTAEITARQELAGYCLRFFKDDAEREKYDNTLDTQALRDLEPDLELAGAGGEITAEVFDGLLCRAREGGISLDEAHAYIVAFASRRGWVVYVPRAPRAQELQRCACGVLNPETARTCGHCGDTLKVECPKCRTVNPSEHRACMSCGFAVGDLRRARSLMRDADVALARGDAEAAVARLREAQVYWPESSEIAPRLDAARRRMEAVALAHRRVLEALADRRLLEARIRLGELRAAAPSHPQLDTLTNEADAGLRTAHEHLVRARGLERSGRPDDALAAYSEAARACVDLREAVEAASRFPPDPPSGLQAVPTAHGIALRWAESPSRGPLRYRVVRKGGSEPRTPGDGVTVGEVVATALTDDEATPGEPLYYAVFAERGGLASARPALVGPVLRVAEVADLRAVAGDSRVALDWRAPARAVAVEVWRREGVPPGGRGDGTRLTGHPLSSAADAGLTNERPYGYRVVALFRGADGRLVHSEGVTCIVVPAPPTQPVLDLIYQRRGTRFDASWTPPARGQVCLYAADAPRHECGAIVSVAELDALGQRVPAIGPGAARGEIDGSRVVHLVPVTVDGSTAVVGQSVPMSWIDDVEGVKGSYGDGILRVRWSWPAGIEAALVSIREDRYPTGPDDPAATHVPWMKHRSEREGGFVHRWPATSDRLFLAVRAVAHADGRPTYAAAVSPGTRDEVAVGQRRAVLFDVRAVPGRWGIGKSGEYELVITPDALTELPALVLVAKPGGRPLSPRGGQSVWRLPAGVCCAPDAPLRVRICPSKLVCSHGVWLLAGELGGSHGVWLFSEDDADCAWLDLIPAAPAGYTLG